MHREQFFALVFNLLMHKVCRIPGTTACLKGVLEKFEVHCEYSYDHNIYSLYNQA